MDKPSMLVTWLFDVQLSYINQLSYLDAYGTMISYDESDRLETVVIVPIYLYLFFYLLSCDLYCWVPIPLTVNLVTCPYSFIITLSLYDYRHTPLSFHYFLSLSLFLSLSYSLSFFIYLSIYLSLSFFLSFFLILTWSHPT